MTFLEEAAFFTLAVAAAVSMVALWAGSGYLLLHNVLNLI